MIAENYYKSSEEINDLFVRLLLKKIGKKSQLVDVISDILVMDKRTVYRRINGETPFSFSEVLHISNKLGISLSTLQQRDESFLRISIFEIFNSNKSGRNFKNLLKDITTQESTEHSLFTNMIPYGIQIRYPYLTAFQKLSGAFREGHLMKLENFIEPKTEEDLFIREAAKWDEIFSNSLYIFSSSIVKSIINGINYATSLKLIDKKNIVNLIDELLDALSILEKRASSGIMEETENRCSIYILGVELNTNMGYYHSPLSNLSVYRNYLDITYSTDENVYKEMKKWLDNIRLLSTDITHTAEVKRISYFNAQKDSVKSLIKI